jgi:hypothetical protein
MSPLHAIPNNSIVNHLLGMTIPVIYGIDIRASLDKQKCQPLMTSFCSYMKRIEETIAFHTSVLVASMRFRLFMIIIISITTHLEMLSYHTYVLDNFIDIRTFEAEHLRSDKRTIDLQDVLDGGYIAF